MHRGRSFRRFSIFYAEKADRAADADDGSEKRLKNEKRRATKPASSKLRFLFDVSSLAGVPLIISTEILLLVQKGA